MAQCRIVKAASESGVDIVLNDDEGTRDSSFIVEIIFASLIYENSFWKCSFNYENWIYSSTKSIILELKKEWSKKSAAFNIYKIGDYKGGTFSWS